MMQMQFDKNFDLDKAYEFLKNNKNLGSLADEIDLSHDKYGGYTTTLKRAKIIKVLTDNGLLDTFINSVWPSGNVPKRGRTRIDFWLRVYSDFKKESQNTSNQSDSEEDKQDIDEIESSEEKQFAAERDLHNYLASNLTKIEPGLKLYQSPDGTSGNEYIIDNKGRRIDILALDNTGMPVIIELKVSRGHERVLGQVLYYDAMIKKLLRTEKTRIIIIANQISEELRLASETVKTIELFEYKISMELTRITK
jgi:hypothetical protein